MISKVKNINYLRLFNKYSLFTLIFIFHSIYLFQGFDTTDTGFHLTHQVFAVKIPVDVTMISELYFFTDFVGGLWLSIIDRPNLVWAKLAGILMISLNAVVVYSILASYYNERKVFFIVVISTLLVTMRYMYPIIDYFSFPALLINIQLWLFHKLISDISDRKLLYAFLLGFISIPVILSRITVALILIIPIVILIYLKITKNQLVLGRNAYYGIFLGFVFSSIIFIIFYWYIGVLDAHISKFLLVFTESVSGQTANINESHSMKNLLYQYFKDTYKTVINVQLVFFNLYLFSRLNLVQRLKSYSNYVLLIVGISVFTIYLIYNSPNLMGYSMVKLLGGLIFFSSLYILYNDKSKNLNLNLLMIASLVVMLITPIGSDTGFYKSLCGMWLILPLALIRIFDQVEDFKNNEVLSVLSLKKGILLFLILTSLFFHATNAWRDDNNRLELVEPFSHPSLKGTFSTPDRVKVVDELLYQINNYSNPGDEVLFLKRIPIFYYLTETKPAYGDPWPFLKSIDVISQKQNTLEEQDRLPKLVVFSKLDNKKNRWPNSSPDDNPDYMEKMEYMEKLYIELNYSMVWENEAFSMYLRPDSNS